MEFLSQFDCKLVYVKGEDNTVADALSCLLYDLPDMPSSHDMVPSLMLMYVHDDDMITACIGAVWAINIYSPFASA